MLPPADSDTFVPDWGSDTENETVSVAAHDATTPLLTASGEGHLEVVQVLLQG